MWVSVNVKLCVSLVLITGLNLILRIIVMSGMFVVNNGGDKPMEGTNQSR